MPHTHSLSQWHNSHQGNSKIKHKPKTEGSLTTSPFHVTIIPFYILHVLDCSLERVLTGLLFGGWVMWESMGMWLRFTLDITVAVIKECEYIWIGIYICFSGSVLVVVCRVLLVCTIKLVDVLCYVLQHGLQKTSTKKKKKKKKKLHRNPYTRNA